MDSWSPDLKQAVKPSAILFDFVLLVPSEFPTETIQNGVYTARQNTLLQEQRLCKNSDGFLLA